MPPPQVRAAHPRRRAARRVGLGLPGGAGLRTAGHGRRHRGDGLRRPQQRRVQELQERADVNALQVSHICPLLSSVNYGVRRPNPLINSWLHGRDIV